MDTAAKNFQDLLTRNKRKLATQKILLTVKWEVTFTGRRKTQRYCSKCQQTSKPIQELLTEINVLNFGYWPMDSIVSHRLVSKIKLRPNATFLFSANQKKKSLLFLIWWIAWLYVYNRGRILIYQCSWKEMLPAVTL